MAQSADAAQVRYYGSVQAVAERVILRLGERAGRPDDLMEAAHAALRKIEARDASEHLWIFRDPSVLSLSDAAFDALDAREDGTRDWLQADLASAVAAVARFDVLQAVSELALDLAEEEPPEDEAASHGVGRA